MSEGFRPAEHVRQRRDFERIYDRGSKFSSRSMTLFALAGAHQTARLGVAATRKMGGAVERNRAKRLARELFRHQKPPAGVDVVIVPRREMLQTPYARLEAEFRALLDRFTARRRG